MSVSSSYSRIRVASLLLILLLAACAGHTKTVTITTVPPGAQIELNGDAVGKSPVSQTLKFDKVQEFQVVASKEGYEEASTKIAYEPKEKVGYDLELTEMTKVLVITSDPSGATVRLDGGDIGITPLQKDLSFVRMPEHLVMVTKDGFDNSGVRRIRYEPRDSTVYHFRLEKKEIISLDLVSVEPQSTDQGVRLAVIRRPTLAYLEVIERSPNVSSVTRVTSNEDPSVQIGPPVLSPVDDTIVYPLIVSETSGSSFSNIWKETVGSFAKARVTYGKSLDVFPAFTPDGNSLVFSSNRAGGNSTLWRIRVEGGGGITKLTYTQAEDYYPSLSADGRTIAYASNPPGADEAQIWTTSENGSLPTQLREGGSPHLAPAGNRILFVRRDSSSGKTQIWVMNTDGSNETQLTQNTEYDAVDPKWSPDGAWIIYASDEGLDSRKNQNYDIWMMSSEGSRKTQLTTNGSRDDGPCWNHTGDTIYFRSNRGGAWNIWRFRPIPG